MIDVRRDRHLGKRTTVRPPTEVKRAALRVLHDNGWTLNDYVQACLVQVADNPEDTLRSLEPIRPQPKMGRPAVSDPKDVAE